MLVTPILRVRKALFLNGANMLSNHDNLPLHKNEEFPQFTENKKNRITSNPPTYCDSMDREFWRAHVFALYCEGRYFAHEAQTLLGISRSHFFRLLAQFRQHGPTSFFNSTAAKPKRGGYSIEFKARVIRLIQERYFDHPPTLTCDILFESHSITISPSTARRWMIEAGLWSTRNSIGRKFHQPRKRQPIYGQQIQIDGSEHLWFERRGPKCCAMVLIDDATGRWQLLRFFKQENSDAYVTCASLYVQRYGRPVRFVSDKHSAIKSDAKITLFEQGLANLNIAHTFANTAPSNGQGRESKPYAPRPVGQILQTCGDIQY